MELFVGGWNRALKKLMERSRWVGNSDGYLGRWVHLIGDAFCLIRIMIDSGETTLAE